MRFINKNLKKEYFRCALTNIYFCPTEAENFPSEDDRWMHISFDIAYKCDIYLNKVRVEHVVAFFDLGQYRVAGEKIANMSFLTQHQHLLDGQIRYFLVKDTIDFLNFKCTFLNSKNEKLTFKKRHRSCLYHTMEPHLLKYTFVLYRTQFNGKNPVTLEVEENSINECKRQYEGKKCQCVVSKILFMPNKALNFPDEEDHYVHVQFENAQTPVTFINIELTELIVCSFNLN